MSNLQSSDSVGVSILNSRSFSILVWPSAKHHVASLRKSLLCAINAPIVITHM